MCTAATYKTDGFYFGRTLDYEFSYGDEIVVTPRRFPLAFSGGKALSEHFALLGMAHVADGYPLYYDAMYAILPADYPTNGRDFFPIEAFAGKEFLMPYGRFDIDVNAALSPKGVRPQIRPCHVDDETVIRMVSKGLGVSMMTEIMMRGRTQGVQTLPVTPRAGRELGMGMPLRKNMPEEVLRLRDCVLDFIHEL